MPARLAELATVALAPWRGEYVETANGYILCERHAQAWRDGGNDVAMHAVSDDYAEPAGGCDECLEPVLNAYTVCALWASTDESGDPLDGRYGTDDLADETLDEMRADVAAFIIAVRHAGLATERLPDVQIGHDFWLTRNHHGAGFWDRGQGELGDALTELAQSFGSYDLYVGDDGLIYGA